MRDAAADWRLCSGDRRRSAGPLCQTAVCAALCQSCKSKHETDPLWEFGPQEQGGTGQRRYRQCDDQSDLRCGCLCGGNAEIHDRDLRHRRGPAGICSPADLVRLAAGVVKPGLSAGFVFPCREDEGGSPAERSGGSGKPGAAQRRHSGPGLGGIHLPGVWL